MGFAMQIMRFQDNTWVVSRPHCSLATGRVAHGAKLATLLHETAKLAFSDKTGIHVAECSRIVRIVPFEQN